MIKPALPIFSQVMSRGRPRADWESATDSELVLAARLQDAAGKGAFVEIVRRHQGAVAAVAFGVAGRAAWIDDITQETFLLVWQRLGTLREPGKLKAWLMRIAQRCAVHAVRKSKPGVPLEEAALDLLASEIDAPDAAAIVREEEAVVWTALEQLPEDLRLPLVLYYQTGRSSVEVAAALDLSHAAVRQRLSRGRDALRDLVAARVEGVLERIRPSPAVLAGVALAIGWLASPTVVAGSAFSAAATASTTTTSATTVAATMSTSKTSVAIAALVAAACLPLGYGARMGVESPLPAAGKVAQNAVKEAPVKKVPDFKDTALYAEWRKLHDEHGSTADAMPVLYKAISDIKDPVRRRVFRAAQIAEWAEIAPEAGLAFFMGKNRDGTQRDQFFNEWLQLDAPAAVDALLTTGTGAEWEGMARRSLVEIAKRVPGRVAEIAARLPKTDSYYWDNEVRHAFAVVAAGDLDAARSVAESLAGGEREMALAGVAKAWAKTDVNAAIAWAKSLPGGVDRDEIIRSALIGLASARPGDALDKVKTVSPGGRQGYVASTTGARVLAEAIKTDYDATVAWLAAHPGQLGNEDMLGMANAVIERLNADPAGFLKKHLDGNSLAVIMPAVNHALLNQAGGQRPAIWEWIKTQPESAVTRELRQQIISSAGYQDPDFAIKLAADIPQSKEGDESIRHLANSLMYRGQMLSHIDSLMEKVPERLRLPLLDIALNYINGDTLGDPQKWISRVAQAPEGQRNTLTARVAFAWAQQSPEEAVAWATNLPDAGARFASIASAANAWANKDPYGASEWITSLPAGLDKDNAASSLVRSIATDSPVEAWEWALSIGNESARKGSASWVIDAMQKRDPATARQWIDSGPFTADEKTQMRTALENRTSASGAAVIPPAATR